MKAWCDLEIGEEVKLGDRYRAGNKWVPAFPVIIIRYNENYLIQRPVEIPAPSISLEDHFAGLAMQAHLMHDAIVKDVDTAAEWLQKTAEASYDQAAAMMAEKKRRAEL